MKRILYICSSWPHGPGFGGQLRALHIGRALKSIGEVKVLLVGSEAADRCAREKTASEFEVELPILPIHRPNRGVSERLRWAFSAEHMNLHGYVASDRDRERLDRLITAADLVWVLNARTPNILQRWTWSNAHLDLDDIPSTYLGTVAATATSASARIKARLQQKLFYRRERRFGSRFTTLSVCSSADRAYLGANEKIHVIPNGFEQPATTPLRKIDPATPRIGFIGLFSYAPNLQGIEWFLRNCWPTICEAIPGVRLRLVGKETDGPLKPQFPGVDGLGWVSDPTAEISTWSAMIVPVRVGGGTRIKIAEAFSRKCPVVSTSLGAFGYEVSHGRHLLLADQPEDFSRQCIHLIKDPKHGLELAEAAWGKFLQHWTWAAIAPKVWIAAEDCLRRSDQTPLIKPISPTT